MAKTPRDLADRMAVRRRQTKADDGYARETFTQPREQARQTARAGLVSIAMAINNKAHFIEHPPFRLWERASIHGLPITEFAASVRTGLPFSIVIKPDAQVTPDHRWTVPAA